MKVRRVILTVAAGPMPDLSSVVEKVRRGRRYPGIAQNLTGIKYDIEGK